MSDEQRPGNTGDRYDGYQALDNEGEKVGKISVLFTDGGGQESYVSVDMGFFGNRTVLIPIEMTRVDDEEETVEISESQSRIRDAPNFDGAEIQDSYEDDVRRYFGLATFEQPLAARGPEGEPEAAEADQTYSEE